MHRALPAGVILAVSALAAAAAAQQPRPAPPDNEALVALLRRDLRAQKAEILSKNLQLDAAQAVVFWPIYKRYQAERAILDDERKAIVDELAEHLEALSDERARGLLERSFAVEEKRLALERRYRDELLEVLPAASVARFFELEGRLEELIDLRLSSKLPLVAN